MATPEGGPTQYGHKLSAEGFGPQELVRQAMLAEASGFDFVEVGLAWADNEDAAVAAAFESSR